jgi:GNAT superfamily N-acetyltransferase
VSLELRTPREEDLVGVFACLRSYGHHLLGDHEVADPDFCDDAILTVRNGIVHVDLEDKAWVAARGDEVVGFCCWDWIDRGRGSAMTILIAVLPSARGVGAGSLLQRRRMDDMRVRGAREVHTWTDGTDSADWFCRRFGYRAIGVEPVRHALHCWLWRGQTYWGIHRGHRSAETLTHLVADLTVRRAS